MIQVSKSAFEKRPLVVGIQSLDFVMNDKDVYTCLGKIRAHSCYRSQIEAYMSKLLIMKFVFKKVALVSIYYDSKLPKKVKSAHKS